MAEAASVLYSFFTTTTLLWLFIGVGVGLIIGLLPGLGTIPVYGILIPFTLHLNVLETIALMLGIKGVTDTSGPITSVLFGIPGQSGAQATVLDGYPMSQKGEADRALGAAYMASLLGGCIGAVVLALSIPFLRAIMMIFGLPEFFALSVVGIVLVSIVSSGSMVKGLMAGCAGALLGLVGQNPQTATIRWDFGQLFLLDGLPRVAIFVGMFGIPELIDLFVKGTSVSDVPFFPSFKKTYEGMMDCFRNWGLLFFGTIMGLFLGAIPGLGGGRISWICYGLARAFAKGAAETFGKGDVRGVIVPEAANNSEEPGMVIPTMAFGIPGSPTMAMFLVALSLHGIQPGRTLFLEHFDVVLTIVYVLFVANIIGAATCLLFTKQLSKLTSVKADVLVPMLLVLIVLAAYQSDVGDLVVLFSSGFMGWLMTRFRWPRAPLVLALVMAPMTEQYYVLTALRYETLEWLARPIVIVFLVLAILIILSGIKQLREWIEKVCGRLVPR